MTFGKKVEKCGKIPLTITIQTIHHEKYGISRQLNSVICVAGVAVGIKLEEMGITPK